MHDETHPRTFWRLGMVERLIDGHDRLVKAAIAHCCIRIRNHNTKMTWAVAIYPLGVNHLAVMETENTEGKEVERIVNQPRRNVVEMARQKINHRCRISMSLTQKLTTSN